MFGYRVTRGCERGTVLRWPKVQPKGRGPELTWINRVSDRPHEANLQTICRASGTGLTTFSSRSPTSSPRAAGFGLPLHGMDV